MSGAVRSRLRWIGGDFFQGIDQPVDGRVVVGVGEREHDSPGISIWAINFRLEWSHSRAWRPVMPSADTSTHSFKGIPLGHTFRAVDGFVHHVQLVHPGQAPPDPVRVRGHRR